VTERPILFSAPMVRAIQEGSKTQTRRVAKFKPRDEGFNLAFSGMHAGHYANGRPETGFVLRSSSGGCWNDRTFPLQCPYGQPGDRLVVRETFFAYGRWETRYSAKKGRDEWHFIDMTVECDRAYQYAAENPDVPLAKGRGGVLPGWCKRPAIHMPHRSARILLEIVGVRVERLNDCSDADAIAEGINRTNTSIAGYAKERYRRLWESINGAGSWDTNPWVWVVEFKKVDP